MTADSVTRWKRYGNDRLYVSAPDGSKVGWHDLVTSTDHPEVPELAPRVAAAVASWRVEHEASASKREDCVTADSSQVLEVEAPWTDYAHNSAGRAAAAEAERRLLAAPVKTLVARVVGAHTDERAWRLGAEGERLVGEQLDRMSRKDPRWRVLHALRVGSRGTDIDHLVVGPGGVYAINAKHHPGASITVSGDTLRVNGRVRPYVARSRSEAERAAVLLSKRLGAPVPVVGVVCPVNAKSFHVKCAPKDVVVVNRKALVPWLRERGDSLSSEQADSIFDAARRSTTWEQM